MAANFLTDLAWSEAAGYEPFWDAVYKKAFPNMVGHLPTPGDNEAQRRGVDRIIQLTNGKTLYVDEKKRRQSYPDFFLEFISVDRTGAPGWIEKDLAIDFLAYAFIDTRRAYLLPWEPLRRAWRHFGEEWKARYGVRTVANSTYNTVGVCVPIAVVRSAVSRAMIISVGEELGGWAPPSEPKHRGLGNDKHHHRRDG